MATTKNYHQHQKKKKKNTDASKNSRTKYTSKVSYFWRNTLMMIIIANLWKKKILRVCVLCAIAENKTIGQSVKLPRITSQG